MNNAVLQLHQAAQRFYRRVLLVRTFYTPDVDNLSLVRTQAERIDPRLIQVWPGEAKRDYGAFTSELPSEAAQVLREVLPPAALL